MSSSPPSRRRPLRAARGWLAGRSLRTRLVFALLALLALVSVAIGGLTTVALRHFLIDRLDAQLAPATGLRGDRPGRPAFPGNGPAIPPGLPSGTVVAEIADGRVTSARTLTNSASDAFPDPRSVPVGEVAALADLTVDTAPRTVDLGDRGDYRAVARQYWDGRVRVVAIPLAGVQEIVWRMVAAQLGVAAAGLIIAGAAGALIVRATLRPLHRVAATATHVAELPLDRGEVALAVRVPAADTDPRTEVGQVGAALNRMLGHVADALSARQASETRVRQFVADASHELRTPLAAIRGYAEVARRGRDEVPADVAHALRRVESESTRMTSLVDDLLLLARLDTGRPLAVEPVDLTALVVDAVSDAHVAGSRAPVAARTARRGDPGARRRRPAAPGGGEPAHQRPGAHPAGQHCHHHVGRRRRQRRAHRRRRRAWGAGGAATGDLRAVRPGRQFPVPCAGQHRPRPRDRRGGGGGPPRHRRGAEPSGSDRLHRPVAESHS